MRLMQAAAGRPADRPARHQTVLQEVPSYCCPRDSPLHCDPRDPPPYCSPPCFPPAVLRSPGSPASLQFPVVPVELQPRESPRFTAIPVIPPPYCYPRSTAVPPPYWCPRLPVPITGSTSRIPVSSPYLPTTACCCPLPPSCRDPRSRSTFQLVHSPMKSPAAPHSSRPPLVSGTAPERHRHQCGDG